MIDLFLVFLRQELSDHLARLGEGAVEGVEDRVVFPSGEKPEADFKVGAVTLMLVGLQEEPVLRAPDRFLARSKDGGVARGVPSLRLSATLLVAARHRLYDQSLRTLSQVIVWCQAHPVLDRVSAPALDPRIERVTLELLSLTLSEQNELWSAIGTGYLPSVVYRVRLIVFTDEGGARAAPTVTGATRKLVHHAG